jgi:hypothetical protein
MEFISEIQTAHKSGVFKTKHRMLFDVYLHLHESILCFIMNSIPANGEGG